jgi:hypothetical protein
VPEVKLTLEPVSKLELDGPVVVKLDEVIE